MRTLTSSILLAVLTLTAPALAQQSPTTAPPLKVPVKQGPPPQSPGGVIYLDTKTGAIWQPSVSPGGQISAPMKFVNAPTLTVSGLNSSFNQSTTPSYDNSGVVNSASYGPSPSSSMEGLMRPLMGGVGPMPSGDPRWGNSSGGGATIAADTPPPRGFIASGVADGTLVANNGGRLSVSDGTGRTDFFQMRQWSKYSQLHIGEQVRIVYQDTGYQSNVILVDDKVRLESEMKAAADEQKRRMHGGRTTLSPAVWQPPGARRP